MNPIEAEEGRTASEVRIPCGSIALAGELEIPPDARGVVLFAHGSGSSRKSPRNQEVARAIRAAGIGTLLFDLLTEDEDALETARFDIGLLAKRLVAATMWVMKEPAAERVGIGYFGASTGSAAALMAAEKLGSLVEAVVSRGGRVDLAGDSLRRVGSPVLLIVGGLDEPVIELNRLAINELDCEKKLETVPGATHLFEEPGAMEQVSRMAAKWFRRHLQFH